MKKTIIVLIIICLVSCKSVQNKMNIESNKERNYDDEMNELSIENNQP